MSFRDFSKSLALGMTLMFITFMDWLISHFCHFALGARVGSCGILPTAVLNTYIDDMRSRGSRIHRHHQQTLTVTPLFAFALNRLGSCVCLFIHSRLIHDLRPGEEKQRWSCSLPSLRISFIVVETLRHKLKRISTLHSKQQIRLTGIRFYALPHFPNVFGDTGYHKAGKGAGPFFPGRMSSGPD